MELRAKAYSNLKQEEIKISDSLNHLLGRYIAYAVNDPKKYPKEAFLTEQKNGTLDRLENKVMTDDEMKDFARAFASKFNKKPNGKD